MSSVKYHLGKNGPAQCNALIKCRLKAEDGSTAKHYDNLSDAHRAFADALDKEFGTVSKPVSKTDEAAINRGVRAARGEDVTNANTGPDGKRIIPELYRHPQGKIISIQDGKAYAYKNGKETPTSATADKLRKGYGSWAKISDSEALAVAQALNINTADDKNKMRSTSDSSDDPITPPPIPPFATLAKEYSQLNNEVTKKRIELDSIIANNNEYNSKYGAAEGRAFYYGRDGSKITGINPAGKTYFVPDPARKAVEKNAFQDWRNAVDTRDKTFEGIENNGYGHLIPDHPKKNTLRVRTQAQKIMLEKELKGQISDGHWENTANTGWQQWTDAQVIVDPDNVGRNFWAQKDNFQLNSSALLSIVGDRMTEQVRKDTGNANYQDVQRDADLRDLRKIFKTERKYHEGDPSFNW